MNEFFDKWVRKTLWLWLPFYAFFELVGRLAHRDEKK